MLLYTKVVIRWITHISCCRLPDKALKAPIISADTARYLFNAVIICLLVSLFRILFSWGRMISVLWCKTMGFSFRKVIMFLFFLNIETSLEGLTPPGTKKKQHGRKHPWKRMQQRKTCGNTSCCKRSAVCRQFASPALDLVSEPMFLDRGEMSLTV